MKIITESANTWIIEDNGVRIFVLQGESFTAVIDTGIKVPSVKNAVSLLSDKPLVLLNTHADRDHIGCNKEFDKVFIGIHEIQYYKKNNFKQEIIPLYEDDVIDLGSRKLSVVDLSGHTPGSIGFIDENNGILISGDPIQKNGKVFMFGEQRSLIGYIRSLERLYTQRERIKEIWPSHGALPLDNSSIEKCMIDAKDLLDGNLTYKTVKMNGTLLRAYKGKENIYLMDNQ